MESVPLRTPGASGAGMAWTAFSPLSVWLDLELLDFFPWAKVEAGLCCDCWAMDVSPSEIPRSTAHLFNQLWRAALLRSCSVVAKALSFPQATWTPSEWAALLRSCSVVAEALSSPQSAWAPSG